MSFDLWDLLFCLKVVCYEVFYMFCKVVVECYVVRWVRLWCGSF